jgi:thiamine-monophosphate kinase
VEGHPHLFPEPRLGVAARLAAMGCVHAAIDISDGLSTDLAHICEELGLAAEIEAAAIPVHGLAVRAEREGWVASSLELALHGGEDYELLFTAAAGVRIPRRVAGMGVTRIGRMVPRRPRRPPMLMRDADGGVSELDARGWQHFR